MPTVVLSSADIYGLFIFLVCFFFQGVGLELRGLLSSVDELTKTLPPNLNNEVCILLENPEEFSCIAEMPTIPILCRIIPICKADFRITISNIKITANNDFKMVPDKITGVTPISTSVIPDHQ